MTKLLTLEEKIDKILEYCEYTKQLATDTGHKVRYIVEIENTGGVIKTEKQHAVRIYRRHIDYIADNRTFFCYIWRTVLVAQQHSFIYNCLSSVKVYIETHDKDGVIIDEEPIDDYEINFEKGVEI